MVLNISQLQIKAKICPPGKNFPKIVFLCDLPYKINSQFFSVLCFQSSPGHKYCSIALCDTYDTSLESLYTADLEYQKIFSHLTLLVHFKRGVPGGAFILAPTVMVQFVILNVFGLICLKAMDPWIQIQNNGHLKLFLFVLNVFFGQRNG